NKSRDDEDTLHQKFTAKETLNSQENSNSLESSFPTKKYIKDCVKNDLNENITERSSNKNNSNGIEELNSEKNNTSISIRPKPGFLKKSVETSRMPQRQTRINRNMRFQSLKIKP